MKMILLLIASFLFSTCLFAQKDTSDAQPFSAILYSDEFLNYSVLQIQIIRRGCYNRNSVVLKIQKEDGKYFVSRQGKFVYSTEGGGKYKIKYKKMQVLPAQIDSLIKTEQIIKYEDGILEMATFTEDYVFSVKNLSRTYKIDVGRLYEWEGVVNLFYK